jgi:hypothetical protein
VLSETDETKQIENLDALVNLEELWLGKNKIAKLEVVPFAYCRDIY